jgi:hypothetical protein
MVPLLFSMTILKTRLPTCKPLGNKPHPNHRPQSPNPGQHLLLSPFKAFSEHLAVLQLISFFGSWENNSILPHSLGPPFSMAFPVTQAATSVLPLSAVGCCCLPELSGQDLQPYLDVLSLSFPSLPEGQSHPQSPMSVLLFFLVLYDPFGCLREWREGHLIQWMLYQSY